MSHLAVHPSEVLNKAAQNGDLCIVDVRTPAEVKSRWLPGCLQIPLHELTPERLQQAIDDAGKDGSCVYLLCQGGRRAQLAAEQLSGKLSARLCVIEGGIQGLAQAGAPLQTATGGVISLERQVRIVAGLLVLTGVVLGTWVNPWFYALSGFVGAGLIFAGMTDLCAMGLLLARAPWNR